MGTDVRRTDTMFIAPQRSCSGLQWSKTEWCVYLYSNCRKWPQVLQECDIITFGWFNCWRQHLHPDTVLSILQDIIYCMCLFQHVGKQDRTHARTHMVKIAWRKLVAGILCGCVVLLVLVVKWVMKKTIQTHPYSNCTFHQENSQRKQTSFTVPTNLGKTLAK